MSGFRDRIRAHPRYRWIVLWTLLFGLFAVGLSFTILSVVLPSIGRELHAAPGTIAWVVTGPILAFGVAGPVFGKIGDLYGAKRTYLAGFGVATVFLLFTGLAWNAESLIVFRVLAALEGAATGPAAVKFIATLFPPRDRSRALGWFSFVMAGAPTFGLVAGSLVVPVLGWRAIFLCQVPLCAGAVVLAALVLDETPRQVGTRLDLRGAGLLGAAAFCGLFALNRAGDWGFANPAIIALFAATPLFAGSFVWSQRRTDHPLFPLGYFRERNFAAALTSSSLTNFAYLGGLVLSPFLLERVLGYEEQAVYLVLLARPGLFAISGPIAGYVVARLGVRRVAVFGSALVTASLVVLALLSRGSPLWLVLLGLALSGVGLGVASPATSSAAVNSLRLEDQGIGGGLIASAQSVGASAGTVTFVLVQTTVAAAAGVATSFRAAYLTGAAVAGLAVVAAGILRGDVPTHDQVVEATAEEEASTGLTL